MAGYKLEFNLFVNFNLVDKFNQSVMQYHTKTQDTRENTPNTAAIHPRIESKSPLIR